MFIKTINKVVHAAEVDPENKKETNDETYPGTEHVIIPERHRGSLLCSDDK